MPEQVGSGYAPNEPVHDQVEWAGAIHGGKESPQTYVAVSCCLPSADQNAGYPSRVIHAVDCLTHREGETYAAYIARVATDPMATIVKLADLRDNLRNNKSLSPNSDVVERIQRYEQALALLESKLRTPNEAVRPNRLSSRADSPARPCWADSSGGAPSPTAS